MQVIIAPGGGRDYKMKLVIFIDFDTKMSKEMIFEYWIQHRQWRRIEATRSILSQINHFLVHRTSFYSAEELLACKSLESYNFISGCMVSLKWLETRNNHFLIVGEVNIGAFYKKCNVPFDKWRLILYTKYLFRWNICYANPIQTYSVGFLFKKKTTYGKIYMLWK